ncbi:MAG: pre-peptidase C-terminal domain-containing protein [Mesorhizobium sp.]
MLVLDSVTNVALSVDDVCALDATRISNPHTFRKFAAGLRMEPDFLLNDRWSQLPALNSPAQMFGVIMLEMLPLCYDAAELEKLGGSFSIRIIGVGDYTFIAMNRRVITLFGLPIDAGTGIETLDLEIAPDVLQAFCRGLLLDIADDVLEEDEFEDREISSAELLLHGMPYGGYLANDAVKDYGDTLTAVTTGNVGDISVNSIAFAILGKKGDKDWFAMQLNSGTTYRIEMRGAGSGRGTLADPYLYGVYNTNGTRLVSPVDDTTGLGYDARLLFTPTTSGTYYVSAGGAGSNTGTYQLSVVENSNVVPLLPVIELGGDFQSSLDGAKNSRIGAVLVNSVSVGTISYSGDQDWYAVTLEAGGTYRIDMRGLAAGNGSLADPYIRGIFDSSGANLRYDDDSGIGYDASITNFKPKTTGIYYISAGAAGSKQGTYRLSVTDSSEGYMTSNELNYDFASTLSSARAGQIGALSANSMALGNISSSTDQDWFAVYLSSDTTYQIDLMGRDSGYGMLADPSLQGIYDVNGTLSSYLGSNDAGLGLDSRFKFTPRTTGVYYISAGSNKGYTGSYALTVTATVNPVSNTDYLLPVELSKDFGQTIIDADAGKIGVMLANGAASGNINYTYDRDWFAVALNGGSKYRIDLLGKPSGNGTLADPIIRGIYDADSRSVNQGNDNSGGTRDSRVDFTPTKSGVYYISVGGFGYSTGSYQLYVSGAAYVLSEADAIYIADQVRITADGSSNTIDSGAEAANAAALMVTIGASRGAEVDINYIDNAATGTITRANERVWFAVKLNRGVTYSIDMMGADSGQGTLKDPYLYGIFDGNSRLLSAGNNDLNNSTHDARINFTPDHDDVYYIAAGASNSNDRGTYSLKIKGDWTQAGATSTSISTCGSATTICGTRLGGAVYSRTKVGASACGARITAYGYSNCGTNVSACGANANVIGARTCTVVTSVNGVRASVTGAAACVVDVSGCGANATATGLRACATALSISGARIGATLLAICGFDVSICGARASIAGISLCGGNASLCVVRASLDLCAGYGVACVVDVGFGLDFGACFINFLPAVPSC